MAARMKNMADDLSSALCADSQATATGHGMPLALAYRQAVERRDADDAHARALRDAGASSIYSGSAAVGLGCERSTAVGGTPPRSSIYSGSAAVGGAGGNAGLYPSPTRGTGTIGGASGGGFERRVAGTSTDRLAALRSSLEPSL